jgi:hypothetical protein
MAIAQDFTLSPMSAEDLDLMRADDDGMIARDIATEGGSHGSRIQ